MSQHNKMAVNEIPELHDRKSAAKFLGITLSNLNYHIRKGNLSYIPKVGESGGRLLSKTALEKFKEEREAGKTAIHRRVKPGEYTVAAAAKYLGITRAAIYKIIAQKGLNPVGENPFYVFKEEELRRVKKEREEFDAQMVQRKQEYETQGPQREKRKFQREERKKQCEKSAKAKLEKGTS